MTTLHTFGCSITQGFALPDVVKPIVDETGRELTDDEIIERNIPWSDIHLYQPSIHAWPQVLANKLNIPVNNYARRGACFQQIARQCAANVKDIKPDDTVIVMWTYLSRVSLQWPARTSVPFTNVSGEFCGWKTIITGFNRFFGLEHSANTTTETDERIQKYIEQSTKNTYLDPLGIFNRYYNSLVLQTMTDGFLKATGARVIHLSVETEPVMEQLEMARSELPDTLKDPYKIPDPSDWYNLDVNYRSCYELLNPNIPPAENDMHPSVTHHQNFANRIYKEYFNK